MLGLAVLTNQIRQKCGENSSVSLISAEVCSYVYLNCSLEGNKDEPDYRKAIAIIADGGKPFTLCGVRARMMKEICEKMGITGRIVHSFNLKGQDILSHSFVETYNRSTGEWELYDPYFNVCAKSDDGIRCGLLASAKNGFSMKPCSKLKTENIDWINEKFKDYSDAFIIESTDSRVGIKDPIVLLPRKDFPIERFRVWCEKNYGVPTFVYLD